MRQSAEDVQQLRQEVERLKRLVAQLICDGQRRRIVAGSGGYRHRRRNSQDAGQLSPPCHYIINGDARAVDAHPFPHIGSRPEPATRACRVPATSSYGSARELTVLRAAVLHVQQFYSQYAPWSDGSPS